MKSFNKPSFNSWQHPFWKFGCLLPIALFFGSAFIAAIYDIITGNTTELQSSANQANIDSLSMIKANLSFEGITLNSKFNKRVLSAYNLELQSGTRDSCYYILRHKDYFSGHKLNSSQEIFVYTTPSDSIYQIFITMDNDDVYTDAFFEKYGIENAAKKELPNSIIWRWTWKNQMLELKIPKGSLDLEIKYLDLDAQKRWLQIKQSIHEAEINALMRDKEDSKAKI